MKASKKKSDDSSNQTIVNMINLIIIWNRTTRQVLQNFTYNTHKIVVLVLKYL